MDEYSAEKPQNAKESLLMQCRNTIQRMEAEILEERQARIEAESQNSELKSEFLYLKQNHEDLEAKWQVLMSKHHDRMKETVELEKKLFDLSLRNQKSEKNLEKEFAKSQTRESELEKYSEFIGELQQELKCKQEALLEWNHAVSSIEEKLLGIAEENKQLKASVEKYSSKCEDLFEENQLKGHELKEISETNLEVIRKIAKALEVDDWRNCDLEALLKQIEDGKLEKVSLLKVKSMSSKKIQELTEKIECSQHLQATKAVEVRNKLAQLQAAEQNLKVQSQQIQHLNEQIENLLKNAEQLSKFEESHSKLRDKYKAAKQNWKRADEELASKSRTILSLENRVSCIEESSVSELECMQKSIQSLQECFRLELTKKDQEAILRFQNSASLSSQKEAALVQEISNLREECSKLKKHYSQIISYKEEEKLLLQEERAKLKKTVEDLEDRLGSISTTLEFNDCASFDFQAAKELGENNRSFSQLRSTKTRNNSIKGQGFRGLEEARYPSELEMQQKYEQRFQKKVKQTQEKILVWKSRIRDDLSLLKRSFCGQEAIKTAINTAIEKLERTVSMII